MPEIIIGYAVGVGSVAHSVGCIKSGKCYDALIFSLFSRQLKIKKAIINLQTLDFLT